MQFDITAAPSLENLHGNPPCAHLIYRCVSGSQAYGTALPGSDTDIRGIYVLSRTAYLALADPAAQTADERGDVVYYTLRRYLELAVRANPNVLELLFVPEQCRLHTSPEFEMLVQRRYSFVTKQAYESHVTYARAQIKRARGQNKRVHNPQPEARPEREDFSWFIAAERISAMPFPCRPVRLRDAGIQLQHCHAAAVEHSSELYRIYEYGPEARGVFRGGRIVCESIPIDDEAQRFRGLLLYNDHAYEAALRDHTQYWQWFRTRNENRWKTQLTGEMDYDAKNMMHTFRLLLSARSLLASGEPQVRFEGDDLRYLLDIRAGRYTYDELVKQSDLLVQHLLELHTQSSLPDSADEQAATQLLQDITAHWESRWVGHPGSIVE